MGTEIDIKKRVYSYESAVADLKEQEADFTGLTSDEIAYRKLKTIAKALNEGRRPDLDKGEWFYFPVFYIYTKAEIEAMSKKEIKERGITRLGGSATYGAIAGWRSAPTSARFSYAYASYGFRLCVKDSELAEYFGKQFIELWGDYQFAEETNTVE